MNMYTDPALLEWNTVTDVSEVSDYLTERAKVPGGWLVRTYGVRTEGVALTFVPDANHDWQDMHRFGSGSDA